MKTNYSDQIISISEATAIAMDHYRLEGHITALAGELDFNFRIKGKSGSYVLKISRPEAEKAYLEYQTAILKFISTQGEVLAPEPVKTIEGGYISEFEDQHGYKRLVRMLTWVEGRLWSAVNPHTDNLLYQLGGQAGALTSVLTGFDHPMAHKEFEWDIAQSGWTKDFRNLFEAKESTILNYFQNWFDDYKPVYDSLRKSVVHNDANDNNIIVSHDLKAPEVKAVIDYGDAIYTQSINDLAVTIAYGIMGKPDPLEAALPLVNGYHKAYALLEDELTLLYNLVAMRLIISVTKSAINKRKEPENTYLLISEQAAWEVLHKWYAINEDFAHYSFRHACGFNVHPTGEAIVEEIKSMGNQLLHMFPEQQTHEIHGVDMSIGSRFLGHSEEFNNNETLQYKLNKLQQEQAGKMLVGGYLEARPIYATEAYTYESNHGPAYRSYHLGVDFWLPPQTKICAPLDGEVINIQNNGNDKDYGPTLILKHTTTKGQVFYSLYGHLSEKSLDLLVPQQLVKKGTLIATIGGPHENGDWASHLHFQLMLDMLGNEQNFPGVASWQQKDVWAGICPDPMLLFSLETENNEIETKELLDFRKNHLGKSMSVSYASPLYIQRGEGAHLIDVHGRRYLDTVNNVAHVGHENYRVVKACQEQMAVLNTNTRYLHSNINQFADELLDTFPEELSVVHFVNSGSEANELALRMAKAFTSQQDVIAVEVGYHGNTNACVDVSSYKFDGKGGSGAPEHTQIIPLPDAFRGIYRGKDVGELYAAHIVDAIEKIQTKGRKPAAFICESIISCGGQIELPEGFLQIAYALVKEAGGVCIADEVQVGCGRVGQSFWGFQMHEVIPDIVTIGKPIGNGHPLAAVVCTPEIAQAFANGMEYFNTFGGNPVSCSIGHEVLNVIKDEGLQENAKRTGKYLKDHLMTLQMEYPIIGDVRGQGLFLGFELVDANKLPLTDQAGYLANRMKERGILMSTDGKDNNVLKIKPPLVFSIENAEELIRNLRIVLSEDFMQL